MDIPSSHELGYQVSLPQFRSIVVRAGTPPERVQALADALTEVAATAEYQDFLKEQFADAKSFLGATEAGSFLKEQLEAMRKLS
jgi:tripartite-type tricarboxylate transporter receptor subunit TctC